MSAVAEYSPVSASPVTVSFGAAAVPPVGICTMPVKVGLAFGASTSIEPASWAGVIALSVSLFVIAVASAIRMMPFLVVVASGTADAVAASVPSAATVRLAPTLTPPSFKAVAMGVAPAGTNSNLSVPSTATLPTSAEIAVGPGSPFGPLTLPESSQAVPV